MLSKNKIRQLQLLQTKNGRRDAGLFIVEGVKIVEELLRSDIRVVEVYLVQSSKFKVQSLVGLKGGLISCFEVSEAELKKISGLITPNEVLAVAEMPERKFDIDLLKDKLTLVLDDIQDPGNMGTIIRVADWFGVGNIICSITTVDCYNPKVVQATMGSIARVKVFYEDILNVMKELTGKGIKIYGASLNGKNIYSQKLSGKGLVVIGNESKGISSEIESLLTDKITIPSYSHLTHSGGEAESLNAAIATAVICAEFRRKS